MNSNPRSTTRPTFAAIAARPAARIVLVLCLGLLVSTVAWAQSPPANQASGPSLPDVVAKVDGYEITRNELLAQGQLMRLQMLQANQPDPGPNPAFLVGVLDALIGERLIFADLERRGRVISDAVVEQELAGLAQRYGGPDGLAGHLAEQGTTILSLRRQLRQSLTVERILMDDLAAKSQPSEEVLRQVYEGQPQAAQMPERHKVRHILKRIPADAGGSTVQSLSAELLALREQILDGADFAALAKDHSDDAASAQRGGDLPWVRVSPRSSDFERAAAALGTIGQLSEVVRTPAGLHLIQLVDRTPARMRSFEEMRDEISARLTAIEVRRQILERIENLRAQATIERLI